MNIVTKGSGTPLVLIPGLQGRWEYMRPTVDALAQSFRVITFALGAECVTRPFGDPARGLENYVSQVVGALDELALERAVICGVSFGGLIAVRFAATYPARTSALVLVSTPWPTDRLRHRHRVYARAPRLLGPLFLVETPWRLREELIATFPQRRLRWRFALEQLRTLFRAPVSLAQMGERARILPTVDLAGDCGRIAAPTLVVTGEGGLDRVVPVNGPSAYLRLIRGARSAVIERTGHIGVMTRPDRFASLVREFILAAHGAAHPRAEGRDPHAA